jgi:threonine aldolase
VVVEAPPSTAEFPLKHAAAVKMAEALNAVLSECRGVTVTAEPITNKLFVQGSAAALKRVAKMVRALDVPVE